LAEEDAIQFYDNFGFVGIKEDEPLPMFLNFDVILELFSDKKS